MERLGEMKKITAQIKRLRIQAGLTQAELAMNSGVSEKSVRTAESGGKLSERVMGRIMRALGESAGLKTAEDIERRVAAAFDGLSPIQALRGLLSWIESSQPALRDIVKQEIKCRAEPQSRDLVIGHIPDEPLEGNPRDLGNAPRRPVGRRGKP